MTTIDHELLERLMDRWETARTAGQPLTARELAAEAPELHDVLARRIRVLEWALRHEGRGSADSLPLSAMDTALAAGEEVTGFPTAAAVMAGDTFEGLVLVRLLGRGGMGEVWEANDTRLNRRVAVKFLHLGMVDNAIARRRFAREAKACASVQHENVVSVYDVGEFRGRPFLVMPLLEGDTLIAHLRGEPHLPFDEVVRIGRSIASGLEALHARGMTHRDVKPGNVWLGSDGSVKLLDLGLARTDDGATDDDPISLAGAIVGTPAYMAPEQLEGRPPDRLTDLFSLGVVLYQAATSRNPFAGPSIVALVTALATRTPPPPSSLRPDLPPAFDALVAGLLAKRAEQRRPGTAKEVVARLDAITAGERDVPPPVTKPKRPRWPWLVVAGVVLALIAATVVLLCQPPVLDTHPAPAEQPPSPDEQVREVARQLREMKIANFRTEDKANGVARTTQQYEFTFKGETGEPICSDVENGSAVITLPYKGRYDRESWQLVFGKRVPFAIPEMKTVGGVVEVKVSVGPRGVRLTGCELKPTGDVIDTKHDANVSAREALLSLLREVLPAK